MSKKEKKENKVKGKRGLKFLAILLTVIICVSVIIAITNVITVNKNIEKATSYEKVSYEEQLVPEKDENGNWFFTTDREFKVMQITDVHLGGGFLSTDKDEMAMNAVATMIKTEKPDLVIATGDIAYPVPFQAGTFNNKSGARQFINLMETLGVYWTVNFGNHDTEAYSYFDREYISELYSEKELKYCLFQAGPEDVDGYGNHTIEVKNSKGIITQAFIMMDSHAYTDGDVLGIFWKYDNIHDNQVEWYKSEIQRMNAENKAVINAIQPNENGGLHALYSNVKTLCFFHIPLVEMKDAWFELEANGFKDTESVKYIDGIIGETGKRVYCGIGEDNLFEAMVELGSTKAMFNGHDHYNNATISKDGIIFSYGYSIDYLAYSGISKVGSQRGCTIITCKPDTSFEINKYNYYSDKYEDSGIPREEVTMQFEDVEYQVPQKD